MKKFTSWYPLITAVICLLYLKIHKTNSLLPSSWNYQLVFLIVLYSALLLSITLIENNQSKIILVTLSFCLLLALGIPFGRELFIETVLYLSFSYILINSLPFTVILPILPVSIILLVLFQKSWSAWGIFIDSPSFLHGITSLAAILLFLTAIIHNRITIYTKNRYIANLELEQQAHRELARINEDLQEWAADIEQKAVNRERKRLSSDLHDLLGYSFTNQIMMMEAALKIASDEEDQLLEIISNTRDIAREAMNKSRQYVHAISSAYKNSAIHYSKRLKKIEKAFSQSQVKVIIHLGNAHSRYTEAIESFMVRMVMEGITNAIRHGKADKIEIALHQSREYLSISVQDNGAGADNINTGLGLTGIENRVNSFRGEISYQNLDWGFLLQVKIPWFVEEME